MTKRHAPMHRHMMKREAVPYPSKEAYDYYVVNHYKDQYDEVYPVYTTQSYTTTTASPKVEYYMPRY